MSKMEFMSELESLLQDISPEEREAAIKYYEDYFEDAGPENEEQIITELGTPERIATIIKRDLDGSKNEYSQGAFTENGYVEVDEDRENYSVSETVTIEDEDTSKRSTGKNSNDKNSNDKDSNDKNFKDKKYNDNRTQSKVILIILLCVFGIPIGLPLLLGFFGVAFGVIVSILGFFLSFVLTAVALFVLGIVLIVAGFGQLVTVSPVGLALIGAGLVLLGLGALFGIFSFWLCAKVLPGFITWIVNLCRKPFQKKRGVSE